MKPTEIEPLSGGRKRSGPQLDRLTQLLIWLVFFLLAGIAALTADLWLWPDSHRPVAQAVGATAPSAHTTVPAFAPGPTPLPLSPAAPTRSPTRPPLPTEPVQTAPTPTSAAPTAEEVVSKPLTPPACVPPDDWSIHVVQPGNTLFSLAQRYGTDIETLMYVNCLNTYTIFTNQRLYVPGPIITATPIVAGATLTPALTPTRPPGASATPSNDTAPLPTPAPSATARSRFKVNIPNRYLNIVLLGSDRRPHAGHWRTDSMIIVSVDTTDNVVRLLSIPRDLWVFIPGHGYNRINTADLWGELAQKGSGPDRVKQTIYQNLGIPIHYYVRVDFGGFIKIIDTVGGVDIDVDCPLPDINLSAGMHHMDGKQALRYARSRKSTNDFDRGRRQRKVLLALWDQALTMDIVPRLPELWRTMSDSFQTDLPLSQVINLAYVGTQVRPQHILSRAIGPSLVQGWLTPQGAAVLLPREGKIRAMLEDFYAPVDLQRLDAADRVHIQVLNGWQRKDAEQLAAAALRWSGVKVVDTGPAQRRDYAQTQILVYNGDTAAAARIASQLKVPLTSIQDPDADQGAPASENRVDIQVILGRDYNPCQR